jgi:hypothetical protein
MPILPRTDANGKAVPSLTPYSAQHSIICLMQRCLMVAAMVLLAIFASTVRIEYHSLGWGSYASINFVAPWHR